MSTTKTRPREDAATANKVPAVPLSATPSPKCSPTDSEPPRVIPYRSSPEMAHQIRSIHRRNPWRGTCRTCGEIFPCPDRQDAVAVLTRYLPPVSTRQPPVLHAAVVLPLLVPLLAGVFLVYLRVVS